MISLLLCSQKNVHENNDERVEYAYQLNMSSKVKRTITLSAGEECSIASRGLTQVVLLSGVWDVAGVALEANTPYSFCLDDVSPSLLLYTLEGVPGRYGATHLSKCAKPPQPLRPCYN